MSVAKSADLLLLMVDVESVDKISAIQKDLLEAGIGIGGNLSMIIVINKIDLLSKRKLAKLKSKDRILVSAKKGEGIGDLKEAIWQKLNLMRIFLKPPKGKIDFQNPLILKKGATVSQATAKISQNLIEDLKSARVWGTLVKFGGQQVGLSHQLTDGDILSLIKK